MTNNIRTLLLALMAVWTLAACHDSDDAATTDSLSGLQSVEYVETGEEPLLIAEGSPLTLTYRVTPANMAQTLIGGQDVSLWMTPLAPTTAELAITEKTADNAQGTITLTVVPNGTEQGGEYLFALLLSSGSTIITTDGVRLVREAVPLPTIALRSDGISQMMAE